MQQLFGTPIWTTKMPNFSAHQEKVISWLFEDSNYIQSGKQNGLLITDANLHKNELFCDITKYLRGQISLAMIQMGFKPDHLITSMWATKQDRHGYHHLHNHKNTFLAAAMYIYADSNTSGTTFVSPIAAMWQMEAPYHGNTRPLIESSVSMPFEEGTSHVFPGWLQHYTLPSTADTRIVIALNSMPVGITNRDHFDRYQFRNDLDLPELEKHFF